MSVSRKNVAYVNFLKETVLELNRDFPPFVCFRSFLLLFTQGPFKYYVIKEVGGWGQKMAIFNDLQYCKSSKRQVGGPKKVKNMMT